MADDAPDLLVLTAEIVSACVGHSRVQVEELPALIRSIRETLAESTANAAPEEEPAPAKPSRAEIRKSITPDALISFVDGKRYKTLKRHLTLNGLTPAEYRERYGLPSDYPSVAPAYSASRSAMAKKIGLGARGRGAAPVTAAPELDPAPVAEPASSPKPARSPRRKAAVSKAASARSGGAPES